VVFLTVLDEIGCLRPTYGALIPEGYQLSTTIAKHPWICPVRSCRKLFAKLRELGGHFVVSQLPTMPTLTQLILVRVNTEVHNYTTTKTGPSQNVG